MFISAAMQRSATVVAADDNPAYEYSYPQGPSTSNGWFSGLKAKINQLASISEWMSQLGVAKENQSKMPSVLERTSSPPLAAEYNEDTISYNTISLDDHVIMPDPEDENWDWATCLLADLDSSHSWNDTLEKQHFGPLHDLLTLGSKRKAQGHNFISISLLHPTWCDKCGDFIWGILRQAVKCEKCNYTCHQRCRELVTLDCRSVGSSLASGEFPSLYPKLGDGTLGTIPKELNLPPLCSPSRADSDKENSVENPLFSPSKTNHSSTLPRSFAPLPSHDNKTQFVNDHKGNTLRVQEVYVKEDTPFEWSVGYQELQLVQKIQEFNRVSGGEHMILSPDGASFSGHIQVHMNFTRPISVVAGEGPPTVFDIVNTGKSTATARHRTITSFFLPRNTVKTININSVMTTRQMIVTLLRKFRVADNPRKFALYECRQEADEENCTLLRKLVRISDDVCPLKVVLGWGSNLGHALVLQENDTGDILWDAFEVPELENFIRILAMEEKQYNWQIEQRYNQYRYAVDAELRRRGYQVNDAAMPPPASPTTSFPVRGNDGYGTSDSMVVTEEEPEYVNMEELRLQQSTRL